MHKKSILLLLSLLIVFTLVAASICVAQLTPETPIPQLNITENQSTLAQPGETPAPSERWTQPFWWCSPGTPNWPWCLFVIEPYVKRPTNLAKVSSYPCTIQWKDNSDNEDGFNIYVGGGCTNCAATNNWNLVARVGANVQTYTWVAKFGENQYLASCCDLGECSCVMVRAFRGAIESADSNVVVLAPVC